MKPLILALSLALACPLLAATPAAAQATAPAASAGKQVLETGTRILATLQQRRVEFQKNPAALNAFIESELGASMDRDYAARLVLGPHGRGASEADIKLFAAAMTDNLMKRYGEALVNIEGKPRIRLKSETPLPGNRGVKVSTEVLREGGNPANRADYVPHTAAYNANSYQQMMVQTGLERKSVFTNINYDLTDRITFNSDILYNKRTTDQQIAGYPYQSAAFDTMLSGDSAFNPIGEDIDFRRRLWEVPRTTRSELTTFRVVAGLSGYFDVNERPWDWNVSYANNRNELTKTGHGDASLLATAAALGPSFIDANGVARCGTADATIEGARKP